MASRWDVSFVSGRLSAQVHLAVPSALAKHEALQGREQWGGPCVRLHIILGVLRCKLSWADEPQTKGLPRRAFPSKTMFVGFYVGLQGRNFTFFPGILLSGKQHRRATDCLQIATLDKNHESTPRIIIPGGIPRAEPNVALISLDAPRVLEQPKGLAGSTCREKIPIFKAQKSSYLNKKTAVPCGLGGGLFCGLLRRESKGSRSAPCWLSKSPISALSHPFFGRKIALLK